MRDRCGCYGHPCQLSTAETAPASHRSGESSAAIGAGHPARARLYSARTTSSMSIHVPSHRQAAVFGGKHAGAETGSEQVYAAQRGAPLGRAMGSFPRPGVAKHTPPAKNSASSSQLNSEPWFHVRGRRAASGSSAMTSTKRAQLVVATGWERRLSGRWIFHSKLDVTRPA
jgi:hypothetical protein